jgi:7-cyano-7-deazaguanine synthase
MRHAVILLSGGLDSATALAVAKDQGYACHALSLDYGQRHRAELDAACTVARQLGADEHRTVHIDMGQFGGSALTDSNIQVPEQPSSGIPVTYVPARNTIMLALAMAWAEVLAAQAIYIGVNAVDYSGYPDCRQEFIQAFQALANLATKRALEGHRLHVETPLVHMTKSEIVRLGTRLGVDYAMTVSCYQASPEGLACGQCDACRFRRQGFLDAGLPDVTRYR